LRPLALALLAALGAGLWPVAAAAQTASDKEKEQFLYDLPRRP
jgi:hypothetical protein